MVYQVQEIPRESRTVSIIIYFPLHQLLENSTVDLIIYFVNIVTSVWTAHQKSNKPMYEVNFRKTNRSSLKNKATTSRAQSAYRRTFQSSMKRFELETNPKLLELPEEAHPYGKGNRPSTPVGDVVSNYYGHQAAK